MEPHEPHSKAGHFQRDIILWAVRWYCKYGISVTVGCQEMLAERGGECRSLHDLPLGSSVSAPEMEKRLRWYWRNPFRIFARGTWMKPTRRSMAAGRICTRPSTAGAAPSILSPPVVTAKLHTGFWVKILNNVKKWQIPRFINTDKARLPMVARLLCSNAKAGARPTLNTDRLKYRKQRD